MGSSWAPGDRVYLVSTAEGDTILRAGLTGTVDMTDSLGTVHVEWDPFTVGAGRGQVHYDHLRRGILADDDGAELAAHCEVVVGEIAGGIEFRCNEGPAGHRGPHEYTRARRPDTQAEGTH